MALTDYASLQVEIADWLDRTDLSAKVPIFIQLAEAQMKRRLRRKTVRATLVLSAESTALPSDCAELRSVCLATASRWLDTPLHIGTPDQLADARTYTATQGRPVFATIIDRNIVVAPTPDASYNADISYFQQLTPLSGGATVNATLTEAPDVYLFGALAQAAPYLAHDERIPVWDAKFSDAIAELNKFREAEELSASIRPLRLARAF